MQDKLETVLKRYQEIENLIIQPEVLAQPARYAALMKERGAMAKMAQRAMELKRTRQQIVDTEELRRLHAGDADLLVLTTEELKILEEQKNKLSAELEEMLITDDAENHRNVIMEIRAGTGGEEAALFAAELFRMYTKYADQKGWKCLIMDSAPTGLGGLKEAVFSIEGDDVYKHLRFESGGHRVQRVPRTEASGRIHTSACTVAVLPEAEDVEVDIKSEDLKVDTYSAGGPGGQHVNKTASAVRITHLPTGTVVACQVERSQHRNRDLAMRLLRTRIKDHLVSASKQQRDTMRRTQIGSGDRSEKIRTYNFPQNRITDHRINFSVHNLTTVLDGDLDELVAKLVEEDRTERLKSVGHNSANN